MPYSVKIAHAAETDVREAFLWYEDQKENLGSRFEANVYQAIDNIQNNPLKFQIRYGRTRISFLRKFPYGIHFQINENQILILAVFHTSQDSEEWDKRK